MDTKNIAVMITGPEGAGKTELAQLLSTILAGAGYSGMYLESILSADGEKILQPAVRVGAAKEYAESALLFLKDVDHSDRCVSILVGDTLNDILEAAANSNEGEINA